LPSIVGLLKTITRTKSSSGEQALYTDPYGVYDTFTEEYTAEETDTDIITPPTGYKVSVVNVMSHGDGSAGAIELDFNTSSTKIYRHYVSNRAKNSATVGDITGGADEAVTLNTTTGTDTIFVAVMYRIIE